MRKLAMRLLPAIIALGTLAVITWGLLQPANPATITGSGVGLGVGSAAPNFTLKALNGKTISLSDYRGQALLLNFWRVDCTGCRAEMPDMQKVYMAQQQKFVLLSVNLGDNNGSVANYVRQFPLTFPVLLDSDLSVNDLYHVSGTPTSYFLDAKGVIVYKEVGPLSEEQLLQKLAAFNA